MNLIMAGPCGVGKSAVSKLLSDRLSMMYLDFDEIGTIDMKTRKGSVSPCSVSKLNLMECLQPHLDKITVDFIMDLGGDSIFRPHADNENRLEQIYWLKKAYSCRLIVLVAQEDTLRHRFLCSKGRDNGKNDNFDDLWVNWLIIAEPYWQKCLDLLIDTSSLTVDEICMWIIQNIQSQQEF